MIAPTGVAEPPLVPAAMGPILIQQAAHLLMGRLNVGGMPGVSDSVTVSYCSCGSAFYGSSVADADNRWDVHRATGTGQPMTSWRVS